MEKVVFLDPGVVESLKTSTPIPPDGELVQAVRKALDQLDPLLREVVDERFNQGLSLAEIADRQAVPLHTIKERYYEAKRELRFLLADFVRRRWGLRVRGLCRICLHPRRREIETLLKNKTNTQSWGSFCKALRAAIGERIHPPQILIAHLKHMQTRPARGKDGCV